MKMLIALFMTVSMVCTAHSRPFSLFALRSSVEGDSIDAFRESLRKQFTSDCEPNIVLTNVESNSSYLYWAANSIRVSNNYRITANSGSDIRMKAGYTIVLKPETVVLKGNHYLARIEPCEAVCPSAESFVVPRGISPNNDGYNEMFDLSEICVRDLKIFNRYGLLVYEAKNYEKEWHGQSDKGDLPTATYFYVIRLTMGESITGWVYLQRE